MLFILNNGNKKICLGRVLALVLLCCGQGLLTVSYLTNPLIVAKG